MHATLLKKRLLHRFAKFLRTSLFYRTPLVATSETRMQSFCENLPKRNYPIHGSLHETFDLSETKSFYTSHWDTGANNLNSNAALASELQSAKSDVSISSNLMRANKPKLNKKGNKVNIYLKEIFKKEKFFSLMAAKD